MDSLVLEAQVFEMTAMTCRRRVLVSQEDGHTTESSLAELNACCAFEAILRLTRLRGDFVSNSALFSLKKKIFCQLCSVGESVRKSLLKPGFLDLAHLKSEQRSCLYSHVADILTLPVTSQVLGTTTW